MKKLKDNYAFADEWDCQVAVNVGKIKEIIEWINEQEQVMNKETFYKKILLDIQEICQKTKAMGKAVERINKRMKQIEGFLRRAMKKAE